MAAAAINERAFTLDRPDGERIAAYHWRSGGDPRAVLVVAHGMGEHARRYPPALAELLNSGIDVYGIDHRGHGATIALGEREPGDFGPGGFAAVVEDLLALVLRARAENPGLPLILLGHSMGSFLSQAFVLDHSEHLDGLVLVGTTALDLLAGAIAREPDIGAALNRNFEPARTPFDWLSSDTDEVDRYLADPYCGFMLFPDAMMSMLGQARRLADPGALGRIRAGFPIYVLVGGRDPVVCDLGDVTPLVERYRAAGMDVELALYPDGRHEILNERNRGEVVHALHSWLNIVIAGFKN